MEWTRKISLVLFLLVFIFIFLPWFSFSCAGQPVAQVIGTDLITGLDANDAGRSIAEDNPEILAIALGIAAMAVIGAANTFLRARIGFLMSFVYACVGLALILVLKFKIDAEIAGQTIELMRVSYLPGFWLALSSFAAAAITNLLGFLGLGRREYQ